MALVRDDRDTVLKSQVTDPPRHEMWKDVKVTWAEIEILVPLYKAGITTLILSVALAYYMARRAPTMPYSLDVITVFVDRFTTIALLLLPITWVCYTGIPRRMLWFLERLTQIDFNHDKIMGAPRLLLDPYKGQAAAEATRRQKERAQIEEFIRFIGDPRDAEHKNTRSRTLDRRYGNRWIPWRDDLRKQGWITTDNPDQPNSTWHLTTDPESCIAGIFQTEDKLDKRSSTQSQQASQSQQPTPRGARNGAQPNTNDPPRTLDPDLYDTPDLRVLGRTAKSNGHAAS